MEVLCASRMLGTFTLDLLMICATVTSKENKKIDSCESHRSNTTYISLFEIWNNATGYVVFFTSDWIIRVSPVIWPYTFQRIPGWDPPCLALELLQEELTGAFGREFSFFTVTAVSNNAGILQATCFKCGLLCVGGFLASGRQAAILSVYSCLS